jgi:hypothetical protein
LGFQSLVHQFDLKYLFLDTNVWYASNEGLDEDYNGCDQRISYIVGEMVLLSFNGFDMRYVNEVLINMRVDTLWFVHNI